MTPLRRELKLEIIEVLNLEGVRPEDIDSDGPLFGSDLGLDSIDALELIVLLERKYGLKVATPEAGKEIFASIGAMASFIESNRA